MTHLDQDFYFSNIGESVEMNTQNLLTRASCTAKLIGKVMRLIGKVMVVCYFLKHVGLQEGDFH